MAWLYQLLISQLYMQANNNNYQLIITTNYYILIIIFKNEGCPNDSFFYAFIIQIRIFLGGTLSFLFLADKWL